MFEQIRQCLLERKFSIEAILSLVTENTANALKLEAEGKITAGKAADILILEKETFELRDVISNGKHLFRDGKAAFKEAFLKDSNRVVNLVGEKNKNDD